MCSSDLKEFGDFDRLGRLIEFRTRPGDLNTADHVSSDDGKERHGAGPRPKRLRTLARTEFYTPIANLMRHPRRFMAHKLLYAPIVAILLAHESNCAK